jgi:membrane-bound lytic murein transglycosylase B
MEQRTMFSPTARRSSWPARPESGVSPQRAPGRLVALLVALGLLVTSSATGLTANPAWGQTTDPTDSHPTLVPPDDTTTTSTSTTVAAGGSATTTTTAPPTADPYVPPPVIDARLSPALARVAVQAPDYDSAEAAYVSAWRRQVDATRRQSDAEAQLSELAAAGQRLQTEINESTRRHDKSAARLAVLRKGVQNIAVADYVRSGSGGSADIGLDPNSATNARAAEVMVEAVTGAQQSDIVVHQAIVTGTRAVLDVDRPALAEVVVRTTDQSGQSARAVTDRAVAVADVARLGQAVADVRMTAMVTGTDMSLVALDAYWRAAATTAFFDPACKVAWSAIAGIGRVETLHGRYGGGPIDGNGEANPPIIGPPLDGSNNTAVLRDSDGGAIDTDPVWDRAVGPMAFIPSSWRAYGQDGNGDGIKDVENIYDATLATAGLLCRSGPLDNDANLRTAYFHYNQSQVYVDMLLGFTHGYAQFVIPPV